MSTEAQIGDGEAARLVPHPLRAAILGELHARPFTPLSAPSRVLHFAFDTSGALAQTDRANLEAFCTSRGLTPPAVREKHHRVPFGTTTLRWEQHSEFTTYTWEMPADTGGTPFHPDAASLAAPMRLVPQPGPLLVAVDLQLLEDFLAHAHAFPGVWNPCSAECARYWKATYPPGEYLRLEPSIWRDHAGSLS